MTPESRSSAPGCRSSVVSPAAPAASSPCDAINAALLDAGLAWTDVQVAFGGSDGAGLADTLVADLGLTGIPFTNVKNGCATGGSALMSAVNAIRSGERRDRPRRRLRQASTRCLRPASGGLGSPGGVRRGRPHGDHAVLRHQDRRGTCASTASAPRTLALVAEKAYRNGSLNPNAWRREPISADEIAAAGDGQRPADPLHVLLARRGRRGDRRHQRRRRGTSGRAPVRLLGGGHPHPAVRLVRGLQPLHPGHRRAVQRQRRRRRRGVRGRPGSARRTWTSPSSRTPRAGPRSCTWPSADSASTASRRR